MTISPTGIPVTSQDPSTSKFGSYKIAKRCAETRNASSLVHLSTEEPGIEGLNHVREVPDAHAGTDRIQVLPGVERNQGVTLVASTFYASPGTGMWEATGCLGCIVGKSELGPRARNLSFWIARRTSSENTA